MAIQMRRGASRDFDPSKMLPGEFCVSTDDKKVYIAFSSGNVKELASTSDIPTDSYINGLIDTKTNRLDIPTDSHINGLIDTKLASFSPSGGSGGGTVTDAHINSLIDAKTSQLNIPTDTHINSLIDAKINAILTAESRSF